MLFVLSRQKRSHLSKGNVVSVKGVETAQIRETAPLIRLRLRWPNRAVITQRGFPKGDGFIIRCIINMYFSIKVSNHNTSLKIVTDVVLDYSRHQSKLFCELWIIPLKEVMPVQSADLFYTNISQLQTSVTGTSVRFYQSTFGKICAKYRSTFWLMEFLVSGQALRRFKLFHFALFFPLDFHKKGE